MEDSSKVEYAIQDTLFDIEEQWKIEWIGMPEFVQHDLTPWKSIVVHFESPGAMDSASELLGCRITPNTRSLWYPSAEIGHHVNKRYADES